MGIVAKRAGNKRAYPVKGNQYIAGNVVVMLAAGLAVPFAAASATDICAGVSTMGVDNSQLADGEQRIEVDVCEFKLRNSGDVDQSHVGSQAYFVDYDTASIDHATNTRPTAGIITQVDDDGVWVKLGV
ncbi:hypothetical protein [Photobacterium atrarenae]|uniref:Uncharacterized protein n=1 Tax=Photobacterium atrarenae TaxID=865757 RepID=A0ABY5GLP3_9GAMM|nr:hypothetical protein [Photobacterium atrarenae]UTV30167.1 hypothetical protein NNL38_16405 [Photobacterium atrarenae]